MPKVNERPLKRKINSKFVLTGSVVISNECEKYSGTYSFTPTIEGFSIPTQNKHLLNDITINPIPIREVPNSQGGNTFIIGEVI